MNSSFCNKKTLAIVLLFLVLLLSSCGQQQDLQESDTQKPVNSKVQSSDPTNFSFEETTFFYDEIGYELKSINRIVSAIPIGEKVVIECHAGAKNGVYFIFDTASKSFETELTGHHLIWHDDDITTAIYACFSDVYAYDGNIVKSYDLPENERIYDMAFSDDNTKLNVTIVCGDGTERIDIIDMETERDAFIQES